MNAVRFPVFYSFHYSNDVFRVQQIRNMGIVDGDPPVNENEWERIKARGDAAVERWIDENMKYKRCVIVLIGSQTAAREWVKYEIRKAWVEKRGLFGIYIHNLKDPRTGTSTKGANPFDVWQIDGRSMASYVPCYDPNYLNAYGDIKTNLQSWANMAITQARSR